MRHTGLEATVPAARIDDLVITQSADEVLVYDKQRHEIHHLNQVSAAIWRLCDGRRSVSELARDAGVGVDVAHVAVAKLGEANLFDGPLSSEVQVSSPSRRAFLRKAGVAGAVATVVSISAPLAASAQSTCVNPGGLPRNASCSRDADCCSDDCSNGDPGNRVCE